jgi:hypothetical protein
MIQLVKYYIVKSVETHTIYGMEKKRQGLISLPSEEVRVL